MFSELFRARGICDVADNANLAGFRGCGLLLSRRHVIREQPLRVRAQPVGRALDVTGRVAGSVDQIRERHAVERQRRRVVGRVADEPPFGVEEDRQPIDRKLAEIAPDLPRSAVSVGTATT